jgi:hypothetical protein
MSDYDIAPFSEDSLPNAISPEGAEVANTYLRNACSLLATSEELDMPTHTVSAMLQEPLVKSYVYGILKENGYRHMVVISQKMDELIEKKWDELEEAEIGSNKDIADLLQLAHRMQQDMAKLLQNDTKGAPTIQKNTQVNMYGEGKYGELMDKLLNG